MSKNKEGDPMIKMGVGVYISRKGKDPNKNLILIHGLSGDGSSFDPDKNINDHMNPIYVDLREEILDLDYTVWDLTYNTWHIPFQTSGKWLNAELKKIMNIHNCNFNDAIVVGYSMGGLIARTLVADGFKFKYLVTIDTPHHGPVAGLNTVIFSFLNIPFGWGVGNQIFELPAGFSGINSLSWGSPSQNYIHNSPLDQAKRKTDYAFFAVNYKDPNKSEFDNSDWVVSLHSQLGMDVGEVKWRYEQKHAYPVDYVMEIKKPHIEAYLSIYCFKANDLIKSLLQGKPLKEYNEKDKYIPTTQTASANENFKQELEIVNCEISDLNVWYFFANDNFAYIKVKHFLINKTNKPITVFPAQLVRSNIGDFKTLNKNEEKITLVPNNKRTIILTKCIENTELLPEKIELFYNNKLTEHFLYYVPLPISYAGNLMPNKSIWSLDVKDLNATYNSAAENGTNVILTGKIVNNEDHIFELHNWSLSVVLDYSSNEADLGLDGDVFSWQLEHRFLKIEPKKETSFKLSCSWKTKEKPSVLKLRIGSSFMPAFEQEIPIV